MNIHRGMAIPTDGRSIDARAQARQGYTARNDSGTRARQLLILYGLMIASWMFDFQSAAGSETSYLQISYIALYFTAFSLFFFLDNFDRYKIAGMAPFLSAALIFLLVGASTGISNFQPMGQVIRNSIGSVFYIITAYATIRSILIQNPRTLRRLLAALCLGYVISRVFVYSLTSGSIDYETIRYQILSGATIPALGYLEGLALFGLSLTEWGAMGGAFVVVFLSVTRTYLISIMVQLASLLPGAQRLIGPRLVAMIVAGAIFVAGLAVFGSNSLDRWTDRLLNREAQVGEDITLYTRESEWNFMADAFLKSERTILLGNGVAARTVWYAPRKVSSVAEGSVGFGHNQHLSLLFIGGLIGGGFLLAVQFVQFFQSFSLLARLARFRLPYSDTLFLAAWGAAIILGVVAATFLSSVLNNRSWALWYGLGTGLFLGARARYLRDSAASVITVAPRPQPAVEPQAPALPPAVARRRMLLQREAGRSPA